ncbi:mitochondrial substrate carrier family protein Y-like [Octopus bimaculoides]|uniref:mitochondrial substrate carrier family protein Y-like n=1 Tax=Octopus bimaculoides TaxID=37653 RepID=UPI0022DFA9CE|nr:mitochondrial substrate carrier family protein Y-like [Octopus bimaculoides]
MVTDNTENSNCNNMEQRSITENNNNHKNIDENTTNTNVNRKAGVFGRNNSSNNVNDSTTTINSERGQSHSEIGQEEAVPKRSARFLDGVTVVEGKNDDVLREVLGVGKDQLVGLFQKTFGLETIDNFQKSLA